MIIKKESALLCDNTSNSIVEDSRNALLEAGVSNSAADLFVRQMVEVLDDYAAFCGEGAGIKYQIRKGLLRMELRILIPGEALNPFTEGSGARKRSYDKMFSLIPNAENAELSYRYGMKCNIISISIPLKEKPKKVIKDPIVWGVFLGIACGFLFRLLPQEINTFIISEIASPLQSIILGLISGVMGPVIFISLISSVIALENIDALTGLGFKIIRRFLVIILFLIAVGILVSGLLFRNFGIGSSDFSLALLFRMFFDVIPTNLIDPFLKNNTAQLVILGFLTGAGLLLLGDSVSELKQVIGQINKWVMSVMKIVLLAMPAIPFLSILITLAGGKWKDLLSGWKFIVASYLVFTICVAVKAVKTSIRAGIRIPELWRLVRPVARISFTTGSTTAALRSVYEASDEHGIRSSFSSFWIPMSTAMLSPKTAVNVVITAFMAAQLENMPVSSAFLLVLIIMATELSTASPGIAAACTAVLKSLGLPVEFVGLIATYRLLTDNYGAACAISYNVLEEVEIAHKLGEIEADKSSSAQT